VDAGIRWQSFLSKPPASIPRSDTEDPSPQRCRNAIRKVCANAMVLTLDQRPSPAHPRSRALWKRWCLALVTAAARRAAAVPDREVPSTPFSCAISSHPAQVVQAINNKIRRSPGEDGAAPRVEVARLQAEQPRLLHTTLHAEALTTAVFRPVLRRAQVVHNLVIRVPTSGGIPSAQHRRFADAVSVISKAPRRHHHAPYGPADRDLRRGCSGLGGP